MSCPSAKVPYETPSAALKALQSIRARRRKRGAKEKHGSVGVEVYRCELATCRAWHIGRAKPKLQPK